MINIIEKKTSIRIEVVGIYVPLQSLIFLHLTMKLAIIVIRSQRLTIQQDHHPFRRISLSDARNSRWIKARKRNTKIVTTGIVMTDVPPLTEYDP